MNIGINWINSIINKDVVNLRAVCASVLVDVGVGLHVAVQHRLVDAAVVAVGAFERLRA